MTKPEAKNGGSKLFTQFWNYTKFLVVLCGVWTLGYCELSVAWVGVISVFVYIWMFENHQFNLTLTQNLSTSQVLQAVDVEQTAWLSKVFLLLWPHTKEKVDVFMRNQLQSSIRKNLPSTLQSFTFTSLDLGMQVPQVLAVNVKSSDKEYVILDFEIIYNSDAVIGVSIGKLESSIKDIQVHGTLRVVLTELNNSWPFFGKMNLSFVSAPSLTFRLAKAASLLNVAGFRDIIHESVSDQLSTLLVLPHVLTIPINTDYTASTAYPLPQGVLRIHVNRAKDLPLNSQTDSIDPYCVVQVGATRCKTGIIEKTDHPMWNESFEFLVNDAQNQYVEVECIDSADATEIGSLGSCYVSIATLVESSGKTIWFSLDQSTGGSVSLTPTWLQLSEEITQLAQPETIDGRGRSVAILTVGVESASSLPEVQTMKSQRALRSMSTPSSYVRLTLDAEVKATQVMQGSHSPSWGENFYFLLSRPNKQSLSLQVIDDITDNILGSVNVPLSDLTNTSSMQNKTYELISKSANSEAKLTLSLLLRMLVPSEPKPIKHSIVSDAATDSTYGSASLTTNSSLPAVGGSTSSPARLRRPVQPLVSLDNITPRGGPLTLRLDNDNDSSGQSDLLDFDNWSETASNGLIMGGATYIVISRPDGSTVSEIVQNADESVNCGKENLSLDGSQFGKIQITLRYSTTQQRLMLVIHQCCNLTPLRSDKDVQPDPFVVLTLYNGRQKVERKKTKPQKATLNPVFDETFEFKLLKPNLENALVELSIKNKKRMFQKGKASMGSVLLRVQALDLSEARTDWFLVRNIKESTESLADLTLSESFASRS